MFKYFNIKYLAYDGLNNETLGAILHTENPLRNGGKFNAKGTDEWVKCVYTLDGGEHTIKVMYSKDSDNGVAPDKGYFYIESYS